MWHKTKLLCPILKNFSEIFGFFKKVYSSATLTKKLSLQKVYTAALMVSQCMKDSWNKEHMEAFTNNHQYFIIFCLGNACEDFGSHNTNCCKNVLDHNHSFACINKHFHIQISTLSFCSLPLPFQHAVMKWAGYTWMHQGPIMVQPYGEFSWKLIWFSLWL